MILEECEKWITNLQSISEKVTEIRKEQMKSGKPNLGDRDLLVQIGSLIQLEIAALQVAKQKTETIIGLSRT
jgi:hypothetical protein